MLKSSSLLDPKLIALLQGGAVGVLPTDTVYGLVAPATNKESVARLYQLKSREQKPGTVIAANIEQLIDLGVKARYLKAVADLWPNALSIETPLDDQLIYLHQGTYRQGLRVVADPNVSKLLLKVGPLLTSSANLPGESPANTIRDAEKYFANNVDFYIDGGDLSSREPSTIIRIVDDAIEIIRPGVVKITESGRLL